MTEHVVVEWGDQSGGGFVQYTDPRRGAPPDPAFVRAAHHLQDDLVHQPPEDARDNDRFPVWGLQRVEVEERGPHWCFTVQGRGGAFGRAGSCQFLFTPATTDPARAWATGVALVGPDGRLGVHPDHRALPPVPAECFTGPLTALAHRRQRVAVGGPPEEVAAVIGGLLGVLPTAVVGEHVWRTFPLTHPILDPRPSVTGRWPAELADTAAARRVVRWLERSADGPAEDLPPRADEAIRWLAHLAADHRHVPAHRALPSVGALLDVVVRDELAITAADIGRLVRARDQRLRDGTNPELVRAWAVEHTDAVIGELLQTPPPWLEAVLFDGLLIAQLAPDGRNPAKFPPAAAPAGWHPRLADLVRGRFPAREELLRFVRDHLVGPGRPLGTGDLVHRHRDWLAQVGISPSDPSTGIFPVPTKEIAASLAQNGHISEVHREFLGHAPDLVGAIRSVIARMPEITPGRALVLMELPKDDDGPRRVLEAVLERNGHRVETAAEWLGAVLVEAGSQRSEDAVLHVGYRHLTKREAGPLPAAFLGPVLGFWSRRQEDAVVTRVLHDAAVHLQPARRGREAEQQLPAHVPAREERPPFVAPAHRTPEPADVDLVDEDEPSPMSRRVTVLLVGTLVFITLYLLVSSVLGRLGG